MYYKTANKTNEPQVAPDRSQKCDHMHESLYIHCQLTWAPCNLPTISDNVVTYIVRSSYSKSLTL